MALKIDDNQQNDSLQNVQKNVIIHFVRMKQLNRIDHTNYRGDTTAPAFASSTSVICFQFFFFF